MLTIETKKEIKKAISFGQSDADIIAIAGITAEQLVEVKEDIENGNL